MSTYRWCETQIQFEMPDEQAKLYNHAAEKYRTLDQKDWKTKITDEEAVVYDTVEQIVRIVGWLTKGSRLADENKIHCVTKI
jgi:hypothetical protein